MAAKISDEQILSAATHEYASSNGTYSAREITTFLAGYCRDSRPELAKVFQVILDAAKECDHS